ncbi:hypothetical protein [Pseudomonas sp.]|uniref:hypothetical protein n=1 Tax=Pseudomonas sp. TaxID=306 RepID=UPI003FD85A21
MSDKETRQEEDKISATVRVRMVVDVTVGSWGASASFASLREQAIREAKQKMNHIIAKADTRDAVVVSATAVHVGLKGEVE